MPTNVVLGTITLSDAAAEAAVLHLLNTAVPIGLLTGNMTSAGTTGVSMSVDTTAGAAVNDMVCVGVEAFLITAENGSAFTTTRARIGTVAAAHSTGHQVRKLKWPGLAELLKALLHQSIKERMTETSATAIATQQAIIASAQAAIEALKDGAVS